MPLEEHGLSLFMYLLLKSGAIKSTSKDHWEIYEGWAELLEEDSGSKIISTLEVVFDLTCFFNLFDIKI